MHKYIEWRINISQILVVLAAVFIGWYRLGAVERRVETHEQIFLRSDVSKETVTRLESQISALLREMDALQRKLESKNKE